MSEEGIAIESAEAASSTQLNPAGGGDTVASATMVRCSEIKMSLSMRFRWKNRYGNVKNDTEKPKVDKKVDATFIA